MNLPFGYDIEFAKKINLRAFHVMGHSAESAFALWATAQDLVPQYEPPTEQTSFK
jgi:hypothetical protein